MDSMRFKDVKMEPNPGRDCGNHAVINYGKYELSIIDDGYGKNDGLYEIGVFLEDDLVELPGITAPNDTVAGFLTESEVDAIMVKMATISRDQGVQR